MTEHSRPRVPLPQRPPGRYGERTRPRRTPASFVAGALLAALVAYVGWVAFHQVTTGVRAGVLTYDVVGDELVEVRLEVLRPPRTDVSCTVLARDRSKAIVGNVNVDVPPGGDRRIVIEIDVPTRARAVSGELVACRAARR